MTHRKQQKNGDNSLASVYIEFAAKVLSRSSIFSCFWCVFRCVNWYEKLHFYIFYL